MAASAIVNAEVQGIRSPPVKHQFTVGFKSRIHFNATIRRILRYSPNESVAVRTAGYSVFEASFLKYHTINPGD